MKYSLKNILFVTLLLMPFGTLIAQDNIPDTILKNTASVDSAVSPSLLFKIPKKYSTASIATVSGEDLYKTPTANVTNTLIGRLSGLYVRQSSDEPVGVPGMASATNMSIRGIGSYGFAGNNSYFNIFKVYVNGFESNLNYVTTIPAEDIESISVLKDAAALATFGMKGDNGVLWVVTKTGQVGKPKIDVQVRYGIQQATVISKPLGSYDYARLYNQATSNDNRNIWTPYYSDAQLQAYKNGTGTNVDWYNAALKNSAPYTNGNVSFSGGNTTAKYYLNLDYLNQQSLFNVPNTDSTSGEHLQRYNLTSNLNLHFFKIFEADINLFGMIENQKAPNFNTGTLWNNLGAYPSNIYPVKQDTGKWSGTALFPNNPVASEKALGWVSYQYRILQANFGLKEKLDFITPGLYAKETYSFYIYSATTYSKTANYARYFNGATTTTDKATPIQAQAQSPAGQEHLQQGRFTLGYDRSFGANRISSAVDYYGSNYLGEGLLYYATNYQNLSGRVNYAYKDKYIGEIGFSYFGTDAYAPGNRWGFYPAISAAWVMSNEKFLQNSRAVTLLKIRASVGKSGGMNDNVTQSGRYLYQQYYQGGALSGGSFYMNSSGQATGTSILNPLYTANPDAFAEKSMKYNVGVDVEFVHKLSLSADAFLDKRSGILTQDNSIPDYFGYNILYKNIGKVTNKGLDISATYTDKVGKFNYSLNAMVSYNKNKIDYMAETPPAYPYNGYTGRPVGTPIGLVATGYYQLNDFNADGSLVSGQPVPQFGAVQPGDLKYKDLNGDGKIDQTDETKMGNPSYPQWIYSFGGDISYKGFDFSIFFSGTEGADVNLLSSAYMQTVAFVNNGNAFPIAKGAWAYYPEEGIDTRATATYPRLTTTANNNNYQSSTFWMKNADFLRIHNIELGYTFQQGGLKKAGFTKLRIYVSAINPVTWSSLLKNYKLDPETMGGYPAMKSYNVGISASF